MASSRESSLSSFGPVWIDVLERAIAGEKVKLVFSDRGERKRAQSQFYHLKAAMLRERIDLWTRYEKISGFMREEGEDLILWIMVGHPIDATLERLGFKAREWPTIEETGGVKKVADVVADPGVEMENQIESLFGRRSAGQPD